MLIGYDLDGVLADGFTPLGPGGVVISGRKVCEWSRTVQQVGITRPIYLRPDGKHGDRVAAGEWKGTMCLRLGVTDFYEDDLVQASLIKKYSPGTNVFLVADPRAGASHRV